jgi:multiple sugar transport system permease protein
MSVKRVKMIMKRIFFRIQVKKISAYAVLIVLSFILLFPILYMVTNSFMSTQEVVNNYNSAPSNTGKVSYAQFKLIPEFVTFIQYYQVLFRKPGFLIMFWNSLIITVPIVFFQTVVAVFSAYAFAKLKFPFRDKIFFAYIVVMLMPIQVTLVPNYIVLRKLDLIGSYLSVILPGAFSTFGVVLLRQFIRGIPDEYCEAAKIDGAGYLKTFTGVILPQCKSVIASVAILVFIDNWNMVEQPLVFLSDTKKYPLSIYLAYINSLDLGISFACGILYMIPVMLLYMFGENYLIKGIQLSGLK